MRLVLSDFSPNGLITVSYGKDKEVTLGNTLKVSETQEKPEINITLSESEPEDTFTLVLTDPDAPTRGDKKWSEYCHYIASGIKPKTSGGEVIPVDYSSATELISYQGPAPPPGTGKHRYVFLLLKETSGTTPKVFQGERPTWGTNVPGSGVKDWAAKNKLSPVAVNFFYAQNENQSKSE